MSDQPTLFRDEDFEEVQLTPQPVTCLGMTFESDEARREYFRAELRKKLPELRGIEGFPIGEDDDIINLSDPPYYTACPNPWLNDFIAEWEKEKEQLKAEGKRSDSFEVKTPYAADVSEGKNNPIYVAHTYHTKVPHPAIMRYVLHYTQPGDIVFDGFCGTGMTGVAAQSCSFANDEWHSKIENEFLSLYGETPHWGKRHAICGDLSPYASMIAYNYNYPLNKSLLCKEIERIKRELEEEYAWMYTTLHEGKPIGRIHYMVWSDYFVCPNCGKEYKYWDVALDKDGKCLRDSFACPSCQFIQTKKNTSRAKESLYDEGLKETISLVKSEPAILVYSVGDKTYEKAADDYDIKLARKIQSIVPQTYYPLLRMPEGGETRRNDEAGIRNTHQFYTQRNLILLAALFDKIEHSLYPHKLRFIFTGMLSRSSKMNRMHVNHYFNGGGGWNGGNLKGTLYIPNLPVETSIIEQIDDKKRLFTSITDLLPQSFDNALYVSSAGQIKIKPNSIDYIFTDPPFGANISYSELNTLPEFWYRVVTNNQNEAIENSAQQKSKQHYFSQMKQCFSEYYRILRPGKWLTVEFSNTNAMIWNLIQQAISEVGFVISNVSALDKKQGSFMAVTTTTAVKQDLIISCFKPTERLHNRLQNSPDVTKNIWDFISELLEHLPVHLTIKESTTAVIERSPKILYDRLIAYYVQHGYAVPIDAVEFQRGLKDRFIERDGMYFTASQALEYEEKRSKSDGFVPMALFIGSEADGIEWLKRKLATPKTYQELQPEWMKDLVAPKKGDVLPGLDVILEENFIRDEHGKWSNPDPENASHLEQLRVKRLMKEFNLYLEASRKPKAKRMKDTRLEVLRYGFKECYKQKNYQDIVTVGDHIQETLLMEDEILLQYYDIASTRV